MREKIKKRCKSATEKCKEIEGCKERGQNSCKLKLQEEKTSRPWEEDNKLVILAV